MAYKNYNKKAFHRNSFLPINLLPMTGTKKQYSYLYPIIIYSIAVLFLFYEMALQVSPSIMAKELMRDFRIDAGGLGIMAAFYYYSYTLMQIPAGILFDHYGAHKLITLATLICALGAFFFGNTNTVFLASLGRFLMGIGSSFAFIGVLVVAAYWFHPRHFALLVGVAQFLAALGAIGGEFPLAIFINHYHWRTAIFWLAVIGVILTILSWVFLRDHPEQKHSREIFDTPKKIGSSLKAVLLRKQTWAIGLYAFANWAPITIFAALWGVPFLILKYNMSNSFAALACAMIWIGLAVTSPIIGYLSDVIEKRKTPIKCCAILGLILSLIVIYTPNIPLPLLFVLLFFLGAASAGQILTFALVKDNHKPNRTATAIGANNMAVVAGGAIFQPLVGLILRWLWKGEMLGDIPYYSLDTYHIALLLVPFNFILCILASFFLIKETYCRQQ